MSARTIHQVAGVGTSTSTEVVTICSYTAPTFCSINVEARCTGRATGGGTVHYKRFAGVERGTATTILVGDANVVTPIVDATLATSTVTVAGTGTDVVLRAQGVADKTIEWFGHMTLHVN